MAGSVVLRDHLGNTPKLTQPIRNGNSSNSQSFIKTEYIITTNLALFFFLTRYLALIREILHIIKIITLHNLMQIRENSTSFRIERLRLYDFEPHLETTVPADYLSSRVYREK